jgi:hypothetical protein
MVVGGEVSNDRRGNGRGGTKCGDLMRNNKSGGKRGYILGHGTYILGRQAGNAGYSRELLDKYTEYGGSVLWNVNALCTQWFSRDIKERWLVTY